ncbi:MAG: hypothetical protein ABSG76_20960 [Xanthobacteraceae bacterium]
MRTPSAADLVRAWELGRDAPAWRRGLLLLAPAYPDRTFRDLAALTIGRRNICLFALRERLFGPRIAARVRCPGCGRYSEFAAAARDLCPRQPDGDTVAAMGPRRFVLDVEGLSLACSCPTSEDLARVAGGDHAFGVSVNQPLVRRAIVAARRGEADVPLASLPDVVIGAVADAVLEHDPQADLLIENDCPDCGRNWSAPFDAAAFVWTETANLAQRLLNDVHLLANAYGWPESSILAMSARRRQFYVQRAAQ